MSVFLIKEYLRFKDEIARNPYVDINSANFASTLGVFFTFFGIFAGLLFFDTNDIESSVPNLLEGMKTAFITSIIGMAISMYFKRVQDTKQREEEKKTKSERKVSDDAKISDLILYLQKRDEQVQAQQQEFIEKITNSIVGDGDYTVISQLKILRQEMNDSQNGLRDEIKSANDLLINEFRSFAKDMAENNSKAFIFTYK